LPIYLLSQSEFKEISILIDADDRVWVDWGSSGEVQLRPPAKSRLPYKVWIHTHPRCGAYWSITDKTSLAIASTLLEKALVLGVDGVLFSSSDGGENMPKLANTGPLNRWSAEEVKPWFDILFSVNEMELDS